MGKKPIKLILKIAPTIGGKPIYGMTKSKTLEMFKQILLSYGFMIFLMTSCEPAKDYSDHCAPIISAYVKKITIEIHVNDKKSYSITERQQIEDFIVDIENSKVNGPWKGAKWDKIILYYEDGHEQVFNTNGEVFGQRSTGTFYDLNDKYKYYWKK